MTADAFTAEQEQTFKTWVNQFNWNSRPSVKQANDYLGMKFSLSFPEAVVRTAVDQVFAGKARPPALEMPPPPPPPVEPPSAPPPVQPGTPPHTGKVVLPGYGMSVTRRQSDKGSDEFPVLVAEREEGWKAHTLLIREYCMLEAVESLTNKPEWWRKIRDPEIAAKWRAEMIAMDWQQFHRYADFTENMADVVC